MTTALLVIDVQQGLFADEPWPYEAAAVIARINSLTGRARSAGTPVVFVQHERPVGFLEFGSESWKLEPRLVVEAGDTTLRKTTPDSFLRTELGTLLDRWATDRLVICGYATEFCVDTTTRRAAALGFPVVLVADAHTTHDKSHATGAQIRTHHNVTLPGIASFGPRITATPTEEVEFGA